MNTVEGPVFKMGETVNAHGRRGRDRHPRHEKWEMQIVAACSVQTGND
jgi:hypothetical protein